MYLVENVFEAGIKDGAVSDDILNGNMPITTYIKLINSVESRTITEKDLDAIKAEALRDKLMRDLPRAMHDKMQSTAYMSRLTRRLMGLELLHEVPMFDEKANQMNLTLTLRKHARFQIKAAPAEDESSWSKEFDVTTSEGAREYWSELEKAFKGKPDMDHAQPATNMTFPRLTAVRAWTRKWDLGLENSIILTDRLRESWCMLLKMLLERSSVPLDDVELTVDGSLVENRENIAKAIEGLAEGGLPSEEALRAEQLAEDLRITDGLALVKQLWRDYCYAKIASAVSDGIVSSRLGARALNMYARSSRFRVSKLTMNHAIAHGAHGEVKPKRLAGLTPTSPPKAMTSSNEKVDFRAERDQADFDEEDSDGEFSFATRKKFVFSEAEDEFLIFCMIRFIALSGSNALRAEKRDYRASIVYNDPMWRSRYPQVKRRTLVKRWRQ
ncbi:MAG: hypothetical protein ACO39X_07220, partial [Candidatus Nanopelagicaceae bacterium]